ncbi:Low-density lipoprotein receptor domain class A, partial [Branchiostoma belcheri]
VVDCVRGSDEKDCGSGGCMDCWGGGQCIPSYLWCNGRPDCPGGSDEKFCSECSADEFQCESSSICVPWSRVCDAVNDCGGGSDETCGVSAAEEPWCLPGEYACGSGMCVSDSARCDGVEDCDDDSDEARCECTSAEFRCETSLQCVPSAAICDGIDDCGDGSDELLCMTCEERRMWECPGGECIDPRSVCDGDKDCSLREDERNCQRPCNAMQFECDDGSCLTQYLVCDEVENCPNGEEEINCTIGGCNVARQFRCPDGTCLSERDLCNRREDCSGGEDEMDCGDPAPPGFPVGMASRYIPDHAVTASSELKSEFAAYHGRLGGDLTATSCWAPREAENQWIQVDFGKTTNVTGVIISGGSQSFEHFSWVTSFTLAFSTDGARWEPYKGRDGDVQVFPGNRDRHRKVSRPLDHPVTARYIRLYPTGYQGWVALNMEVYVTNVVSEYDMSASSRTDGSYPHQARLNNGRGQQQGAAWSPDPALRSIPWLQVTHDALYRVAGVITQGAYNLDHWVTSYKLEFSPDCQKRTPYTNSDDEMIVFEGNTDNQRYVRNLLDNPVFALCTRFHPMAYHNQVALRVQVLVMQAPRSGMFSCVWMVFSTKVRHVKLCVDGVQHQGQVYLCVDGVQHQGQACLAVCGWCSAPRSGMLSCVWMVFSTKDRFTCVWMVFSTKHQRQACLAVCGWCSAPRSGMFSCVWMVFSTKVRHVKLCVDGVQHQGQVYLCVDGVQHQGQACLAVCGWCSAPETGMFSCVWMVFSTKHQRQACLAVCGWCSAPRTGVFACVWMVFSTKDRHVCLCVDGVQHQGQHKGQACLPVCGWCSAPRTGVFAFVWMVFSTKGVRIMRCCVQGGANPKGDSVPYLEDVCRASTSTATKIDSQFNECRYTLEDFESGLVDPVGGFESGPLAPSNIQAGPGLSGGIEQVPGLSGGFEQVPGLSGGFEQVPGLSGGFEQVPGLSGGFEQVPGLSGGFEQVPGLSGGFEQVPGLSGGFEQVPGLSGGFEQVPGLSGGFEQVPGLSGGFEQVPVPSGGIEQVPGLSGGALPVIRRKRALEKFHDTQACDGIIDCSTGKDEDNCEEMECVLQCETESGDPCIPARWICDDTEDCLGGEDEQGCNDAQEERPPTMARSVSVKSRLAFREFDHASRGCFFKCAPNGFSLFIELALEKWFGSCSYACASVYGNASCVPDVFVCDGLTDCLDGEDEQKCSEETCLTFFCDLPGVPVPVCVPDNLICDGHADCQAAEDEKVPRCRPDSLLDPFVDRPPAGKPEREGPFAGLEPEEGPKVGQEEGPRVGQEEGPRVHPEEGPRFRQEEGPRVDQDGTAEPSGGSPEKQSEFYAGNGGNGDRAAFWLTAAALGLQIFYLY